MRTILMLIGLAAIALIILLSTGMISIDQTQTGQLPEVKLEGGQAPKFETNVGKVELGTENKTVEVPTMTIEKAPQPTPADQ